MSPKYALTPAHQEHLEPWAKRWIANAMSTQPLGDAERVRLRVAVRGLYEAAGLTPPSDERIVFVPSPFVARFAGGFAAAIWHLRKQGQIATEAATRDATEAATRDATEDATRDATEDATRDATEDATRDATRDATEAATRDATEDATEAATEDATWAATEAATRDATEAATGAATEAATRAATEAATWAATGAATRAATEAATGAATEAATRAATRDATRDATWAATGAATEAATRDATRDATEAATWAATWAATGDANSWWAGISVAAMRDLATQLVPSWPALALNCAYWSTNMWNGGNQWSAYSAYLSFFRHVAQLPLDYSKWEHYETLAGAGPRILHEQFCIISERPETLLVDEQDRPHCLTGPFCQWRDGTRLYAIHGVRVPERVVMAPETLTATEIRDEPNAEVRRVMLERFGLQRFIQELGASPVDTGEDPGTGLPVTLYQVPLADDEPLTLLHCVNGTVEPDGSRHEFVLRVHPQLRPMANGKVIGGPQKLTALNAAASTYGLTGDIYRQLETRT